MRKPVLTGTLATLGLFALYAITMTLLSGVDAAAEQFQALWYLMAPIAVGFGIQVGLYTKLHQTIQQRTQGALTAGGASASIGMLACCAHHATDVLPILGLSAAISLIGQYQKPILIVSLAINIIGISLIWKQLRTTA